MDDPIKASSMESDSKDMLHYGHNVQIITWQIITEWFTYFELRK